MNQRTTDEPDRKPISTRKKENTALTPDLADTAGKAYISKGPFIFNVGRMGGVEYVWVRNIFLQICMGAKYFQNFCMGTK